MGGILRTAGARGTTVGIGADPYLDTPYGNWIHWLYSVAFVKDVETLAITNELTTSIEQPEQNRFIFKFRPDVNFHDVPPVSGRRMSAEDVVYSWSHYDGLKGGIKAKRFWSWIDTVRAIDSNTVELKTARPYSFALDTLAQYAFVIIPREAVEKHGDLRNNPIGTGPMIAQSLNPEVALSTRRHPSYFKSGLPYVDGYENRVVPDGLTMASLLRTGDIDYYNDSAGLIDPFTIDELLKSTSALRRVSFPPFAPDVMIFNGAKVPDIRVREALSLALDRARMLNEVHGGAGSYTGPVMPGLKAWALSQEELKSLQQFDLAKAKQLYAAAGSPSVVMSRYSNPSATASRNADSALAMWKEAGFNVSQRNQPWSVPELVSGDFEVIPTTTYATLDPLGHAVTLALSDGYAGLWRFKNEKLDALVKQAEESTAVEQQKQAVFEAQRVQIRDFIILNLPAGQQTAIYRANVKGLDEVSPSRHYSQTDLWLAS